MVQTDNATEPYADLRQPQPPVLDRHRQGIRWSEKGVRLAQKMQVGPHIPMGVQLYKAERLAQPFWANLASFSLGIGANAGLATPGAEPRPIQTPFSTFRRDNHE